MSLESSRVVLRHLLFKAVHGHDIKSSLRELAVGVEVIFLLYGI